jgi:hypothetical protein
MRSTRPPLIAAWMLEHFFTCRLDEALIGDLFEEFTCGRSVGWFWRQALDAVTIRICKGLVCRRTVLLFAALWSAAAPLWLSVAREDSFPSLIEAIRHMDWPWSSICTVVLPLGAKLAFVWAGILVFLIPQVNVAMRSGLDQVRIGLVRSLSVFAPVWMGSCAIALVVRAIPFHTAGGQVFMAALSAVLIRLPFFATILWALWETKGGGCRTLTA